MSSPKQQIWNLEHMRCIRGDTCSSTRERILSWADSSQLVSRAGKPGYLMPAAVRLGHRRLCTWLSGLLVLCFLTVEFCVLCSAQYTVGWWTVDGGGGTSTGGVYSVSGTVGQADAGAVMCGGGFTLVGGFWGVVVAVQSPGAPYLSVFRTVTNTVVVSWPIAGAEGWVLEATNALPSLPSAWPVIPPPYRTNGANLEFIEPVPDGKKFYRLHKP